jgi:hypothetical protein
MDEADNQLMVSFGCPVDLYQSDQTVGQDAPVRTDVIAVYDEKYQTHTPDGYAAYQQAITLPSDLGEGLAPYSGLLVVRGAACYELLQRIEITGRYEAWAVSR